MTLTKLAAAPSPPLLTHNAPSRHENNGESRIMTLPDDLTDSQIMAGSVEQFGFLFERYSDQVYGYCARRIGSDLAEDITSETFIIAFQRRHKYDTSAASARPWLFGIATNLLRTHKRTETRAWQLLARTGIDPLGGAEQILPEFTERASERIDAVSLVSQLAHLLASMPQGQREILLLHAWADFDYQELAAALNLSIGTVRSRIHRGRARIRKALVGELATALSI